MGKLRVARYRGLSDGPPIVNGRFIVFGNSEGSCKGIDRPQIVQHVCGEVSFALGEDIGDDAFI
jgi:hypothetical protein